MSAGRLAELFDAVPEGAPARRARVHGLTLDVRAPAPYVAVLDDVVAEAAAAPAAGATLDVAIAVWPARALPAPSPAASVAVGDGAEGGERPRRLTVQEAGERFEVVEFRGPPGRPAAHWHVVAPERRQVAVVAGPDAGRSELASFRVLLYELLTLTSGLRPLHGEALRLGGTGCVVTGPSGAGKSTLAFALARAGARLLAADLALVTTEGTIVTRAPVPLRLRAGAYERLAAGAVLAGPGEGQAVPPAGAGTDVEIDARSLWDGAAAPQRLTHILFPARGRDREPAVRRLSARDALARLDGELLPFPLRQSLYAAWGDPTATRPFWERAVRGVAACEVRWSLERGDCGELAAAVAGAATTAA